MEILKSNLVKQLNDLSEWEQNPFKKRAYVKAAQLIEAMQGEEFHKRDDFKDLEGIGDAINKKILQFKETGFVEKWKELFLTK
jgi:DNA polymerase/3'-5' exonuclease PolX